MTDIINAYFRKFYPSDWEEKSRYTYSYILGGMLDYKKMPGQSVNTIFPWIVCADGFQISVQGHAGAYSRPRDDFAEEYSLVECGFPSAREELLMPYIDGNENDDPLQSVYGYVPISVVVAVVEKHGGMRVTS